MISMLMINSTNINQPININDNDVKEHQHNINDTKHHNVNDNKQHNVNDTKEHNVNDNEEHNVNNMKAHNANDMDKHNDNNIKEHQDDDDDIQGHQQKLNVVTHQSDSSIC